MCLRGKLIRHTILSYICANSATFDEIVKHASWHLLVNLPDLQEAEVKFQVDKFVRKNVLMFSSGKYEIA